MKGIMMTKTTGFTWEMEYDEKAAEKMAIEFVQTLCQAFEESKKAMEKWSERTGPGFDPE